jgi:hypothetical protein
LHKRPYLRAETPLRRAGMGKPFFKVSEGDCFDMLKEREDAAQGELKQVSFSDMLRSVTSVAQHNDIWQHHRE